MQSPYVAEWVSAGRKPQGYHGELGVHQRFCRVWSVQARSIEGTAHNGACEMDGVEAEEIRHELGNGSYRMSVSARVLDLVTTNGTINLRVPEVQGSSSYRLRTTNGSVNVSLPARMDLGAALNLQTSVGRVSAELGSLEITHHERQGAELSCKHVPTIMTVLPTRWIWKPPAYLGPSRYLHRTVNT